MKTLKDLTRKEIHKIAIQYATSPQAESGEYFADEYKISINTFYKVLKKAVLQSIVSEEQARAIARKAAQNAEKHGGIGGKKRTQNAYHRLIISRKSFRLGREEAKKWAKKYISSELWLEDFAKKYFLDINLLKRALHDAVIYSWITDEEVQKLKEISQKQKTESIEESFNRLLEKRAEWKEKKTKS